MTANRTRAAVYVRVSTDRQEAENQRADVDRIVAVRGLSIVADYAETESAVNRRAAYECMKADARRGRFDVLVFWAIDRIGRTMFDILDDVREFDRLGVQVISCQEPWLDTTTGNPVRHLLLSIFAWVTQQERERLIERTKAGLERARRQGKRLGRPRKVASLDALRFAELRAAGASFRQIAAQHGVHAATVQRALRRLAVANTLAPSPPVPSGKQGCE